jgi:tRNA (mo5U34)-methyltransferase
VHEDVQKKIQSVRWYHSFEVLPGVITPGEHAWDAKQVLDQLGVPADLHGRRALDVGTWDGPLAFALEDRGADVDAIDVQNPDCTAFNTAKSLRNSRVRYTQLSVYDAGKAFPYKFDLITCFGVYYHLKHPLMGFEALAEALAPDGQLFLEGELLVNYAETLTGEPSDLDNRALGESAVPLVASYAGEYKNASNWFIPNLAALRGWLEAAGLEMTWFELKVLDATPGSRYPTQRITAKVQKIADLGVFGETNIFGPNLKIPMTWWDHVYAVRRRRKQQAEAGREALLRTRPAPPPPPEEPKLFTRVLSRVLRKAA